jgi:hypothetical protein
MYYNILIFKTLLNINFLFNIDILQINIIGYYRVVAKIGTFSF